MCSIGWMADDPSANHVQIDVDEATVQMLVSFDCSGMVPVLPECPVPSFSLIVFLAGAAGDQLRTTNGDNVWTGVSNQKVNVVARHDIIKYRKTEALLCFENPAQIRVPITRKL
jgi:hypothetical protein